MRLNNSYIHNIALETLYFDNKHSVSTMNTNLDVSVSGDIQSRFYEINQEDIAIR